MSHIWAFPWSWMNSLQVSFSELHGRLIKCRVDYLIFCWSHLVRPLCEGLATRNIATPTAKITKCKKKWQWSQVVQLSPSVSLLVFHTNIQDYPSSWISSLVLARTGCHWNARTGIASGSFVQIYLADLLDLLRALWLRLNYRTMENVK